MKPLTHPAVVRRVLDAAAETNGYAAARAHGFSSKTVYRWMARRAADPSWPTDADVETFESDQRTHAATRARKAAQRRDWAKRVYVARTLMQVESLGTVRRLRALYAIGWTSPQLGERLGVTSARVSHLVSGRQAKVHRHTAQKVEAMYAEISMTIPRDPARLPPRTVRVHDRQRAQSLAKGWAPPLAWDDIDDPNENPTGWAYQGSERADRLAELLGRGAGLYEVLRDLDLTRNTFNTWCVRNGHRDTYLQLVAAVNDTSNAHVQRRAS